MTRSRSSSDALRVPRRAMSARLARGRGLRNTLVELPGMGDGPAILRAAAGAGIGVEGATASRISGTGPPGLLLGHANLSEPAIERGIERLAAAVGSL